MYGMLQFVELGKKYLKNLHSSHFFQQQAAIYYWQEQSMGFRI